MTAPETVVATPPLPVIPRLPYRWLGPAGGWIVFLAFTFFWFCNVLYDQFIVGRVALTPNSLVLGGFGMTAGLIYTLAYRLRPQDGITVLRLLLTFVLGGLLSTQLAIFIEGPLGLALGPSNDLVLHSLAGVIEEACKIVTVILVSRGLVVRNARTGLFIGGAVGLGFAAFEDMRYAASSLTDPSLLLHSSLAQVVYVTYSRDLFGPFDHPIMTALLASVLFAATRNGQFRITGKVVLAYLAVSVVHGLIDTVPDVLAAASGRLAYTELGSILIGYGPHAVLSLGLGVVWLVYSRRVNRQLLAIPAVGDSPVGSAASSSSSSAPPIGSPSQ
jgi:RsiW-degrading membrane proteinase PrsW (M82 family)